MHIGMGNYHTNMHTMYGNLPYQYAYNVMYAYWYGTNMTLYNGMVNPHDNMHTM